MSQAQATLETNALLTSSLSSSSNSNDTKAPNKPVCKQPVATTVNNKPNRRRKKKPKNDEKEEGELDEDEYYEDYDQVSGGESVSEEEKETTNTNTNKIEAKTGFDLNQDSYSDDDDDDDEYCLNNKRLRIDEGESVNTNNLNEETLKAPIKTENDNELSSASSSSSVITEISAISSASLPISSSSSSTTTTTNTPNTKPAQEEVKTAKPPKVPPLKIISNPNGGLPYVEQQNNTPSTTTRSKTGVKTRVSSPVTTPSTKTTPTRRANNPINTTTTLGRASPSIKSFTTCLNLNLNKNQTNNSQDSSGSTSEAENVIRRKLRSHTRQLQNGDVLSLSKSPSSSPLTIQPETNSSTNNDLEAQTEQINDANIVESQQTAESASSTRKRRCRQNAQQQQSVQNSTDSGGLGVESADINSNETNGSNETLKHSNSTENTSNSNGLVNSGQNGSANGSNHSLVDSNYNSITNCIRKFLEIRNEVTKRRDLLMQTHIDLKIPRNFQDFLLSKKNYLIKSNKDVRQSIPFYKAPNDLPDELKEYFLKQEKERYKLRLRHKVEQDKLIILYEQEILRCFNKLSREELNQTVPFSFCTIIKDDEVYHQFKHEAHEHRPASSLIETDNKNNSFLSNDDKFLNKLNEIKIKFLNFKDDMIKRQLNESDSLYAVQKMDFQSKSRDLSITHKLATSTTTNSSVCPNGYQYFQPNDLHVPIVHVNSKFELFDPATMNVSNNLSSQNSSTSAPSNSTPSVSISIYS